MLYQTFLIETYRQSSSSHQDLLDVAFYVDFVDRV